MLASGLKYELDALTNKDFRYLTKTYLPRKLKEEGWLDYCLGRRLHARGSMLAAASAEVVR